MYKWIKYIKSLFCNLIFKKILKIAKWMQIHQKKYFLFFDFFEKTLTGEK
jgi:hypothetical protein